MAKLNHYTINYRQSVIIQDGVKKELENIKRLYKGYIEIPWADNFADVKATRGCDKLIVYVYRRHGKFATKEVLTRFYKPNDGVTISTEEYNNLRDAVAKLGKVKAWANDCIVVGRSVSAPEYFRGMEDGIKKAKQQILTLL